MKEGPRPKEDATPARPGVADPARTISPATNYVDLVTLIRAETRRELDRRRRQRERAGDTQYLDGPR
jgi:hypothetical protein